VRLEIHAVLPALAGAAPATAQVLQRTEAHVEVGVTVHFGRQPVHHLLRRGVAAVPSGFNWMLNQPLAPRRLVPIEAPTYSTAGSSRSIFTSALVRDSRSAKDMVTPPVARPQMRPVSCGGKSVPGNTWNR